MKPEQITAWALDEASPEECQHLEAALLENPKDKLKAEETKAFCDFLLSELRDDSLALTEKQRSELKAQPVVKSSRPSSVSGTSALKPPAPRVTRWNTSVIARLAVAACVALAGFWTWQLYSQKQAGKRAFASKVETPVIKVQLASKPDAKKNETRTLAEAMKNAPVKMELQPGKLPAPAPVAAAASTIAPMSLSKSQSVMTSDDLSRLKQVQDQNAYALNFDHIMKAASPPGILGNAMRSAGGMAAATDIPSLATAGGSILIPSIVGAPAAYNRKDNTNFDLRADMLSPTLPMSLAANSSIAGAAGSGYGMNDIQQLTLGANANLGPKGASSSFDLLQAAPATLMGAGTSVVTMGNVDTSQSGATVVNGGIMNQTSHLPAMYSNNSYFKLQGNVAEKPASSINSLSFATTSVPASQPVALITNSQSDIRYFSLDSTSSTVSKDNSQKQEASAATSRSDASGESYTRIIENEMKEVTREPLSTLSIDVDTASYANVRRFLNQNMMPPPDAVRIEELVNYFPTDEEGPAHGAKEPFGVRIELAPCPWQPVHRLARIAIKGREMDRNRKPSNLVFLVDVSGSMSELAKLPLVQQSLRMLTEQLGEGDRVTMVVYAGSSGVVLPPTSGDKKAEILVAIDRLSAGGSTHGSAGIKLAYEQAVAGFIKGGVNRVILCTDGDFNVGVSSPEELEKLIKHKAKTGVFLSVLGFGSGNLKDRTMETLADKGNGNYAYIDSLSEARKVLVEQMSGTLDTIAKDVKIQVEFNPALVRSYRLIGYENRLLAKEDFNDDTKDAGEIGAGHSVVALYEVVPATLPAGAESRPAVDSLKYQTPAVVPAQLAKAAQSGEVMTVKLRYKEPDSALSKLIEAPVKDEGKTLTASSSEYKFSAAVAGFGLLLRDSAYKGTLSWDTVRRLAIDGKGADKLGYRGEFLQLIDKARGLKETQN